MPLDKRLVTIGTASRLSPRQLKTLNPQVFAAVQEKATEHAREALLRELEAAPPEVREAIRTVPVKIDDPANAQEAFVAALTAAKIPEAVRAQAIEHVRALEPLAAAVEAVDLDVPLAEQPLLQPEIAAAKLHLLGKAVGLTEAKVDSVIAAGETPAAVTDETLEGLVASGAFAEAEATRLGLATSLFHLADEDVALADALGKAQSPRLPRGVRTVRDLVQLDTESWKAIVRNSKIQPPDALAPDAYAKVLEDRVARLFPGDALLARLAPSSPEALAKIVGGADKREHRALANTYPGLDLARLLANPAQPAQEKVAAVSARIDVVARVAQLNPETELLALDYSPESADVPALAFDGIAPADRVRVLSTLKAFQRAYVLADDVDDAKTMLRAGHSSAFSVARGSFDDFVRATGMDKARAAKVYDEAQATVATLTMTAGSILDVERGGFGELAVGNVLPSVEDYLRRLPGYEKLFGSQAFCACEHCQSLLSPAAYFVDLMTFVDEHVTSVAFAGKPDHPLHLGVRRPDLATTPLTCANTTGTLPTLELIAEILENFLAQSSGFTGDLGDRPAVADVVYKQLLSQSVESLEQPFVLPLVRLASYLDHYERDRADVARALGVTGDTLTAATLGMSRRELELVTQPNEDLATLRRIFGLELAVPSGAAEVTPFDAQDLVKAMGVPRPDVGALLQSRFVAAAGTPVQIVAEKSGPASVQNDIERVRGLTAGGLDRLHRLTRVWRRLPWTVAELDLALTQIGATTVTRAELGSLASLRALQKRLEGSLEETCALTGGIPAHAAADDESLFDRLFNRQPFVAEDGAYPQDGTRFVHPALRDPGSATATERAQQRLQAALGLDGETLLTLIRGLAAPLGADLASSVERNRGFTLSAAHLSLLYRHARLAGLLRDGRGRRLGVADLLRLLRHAPGLPGGHVANAEQLSTLLDFYEWWRTSGWSLDDLDIMRREPPADPRRYPIPAALAERILADVSAEGALRFTDTLFAFLEGVTEDNSRAIVAANAARIRRVDETHFRLANDFDLGAPLTIPAGATINELDARALLAGHHPSEVLPVRLAGALRLPVSTTKALLGLLGADLSSGALPSTLHGEQPPEALVALLAALVPLTVLFRSPAFDAEAVAFVSEQDVIFGLTDPRDVSIATVRAVGAYAQLADTTRGAEFSSVPPAHTAAEVRRVLEAFDPATKSFTPTDNAELARVVGGEPGLLATLLEAVSFPVGATSALERLIGSVRLAQLLQIGGDALGHMLSDDYDRLQAAADALLAALRARYAEREWADKIEPLEDRVRSRKRDALTDHLIRSTFPQFKSRDDLYQHFLIDVELEGCARTSRVVAAISSLQLYVHRVLMNLEQDQRDPADPLRVHVLPTAIPADEWAWRKNYRVWEANRKVFLWPENFIEPELRDDKTPLFEELEATLLQQPVDEQSVLDAYSAYLAGFEEIASLDLAGAFHQKDATARRDVLHLFGVSSTDPPTYYHRTAENAHYGVTDTGRGTSWTPWRKIDVQIGARRVSPLVVSGRLHLFWVEYATKPKTVVSEGGSRFVGYLHTTIVKYTTLRLDGRWTAPQQVSIYRRYPFSLGGGVITDRLVSGIPEFATERVEHREPRDGYTLQGFPWERVYPFVDGGRAACLTVGGFLLSRRLDLFDRELTSSAPRRRRSRGRILFTKQAPEGRFLHQAPVFPSETLDYDRCMLYLDMSRLGVVRWGYQPRFRIEKTVHRSPLLRLGSRDRVEVINGSCEDSLIASDGDLLLLQGSVRPAPSYLLRRAGTTLGPRVARRLFTSGVDGLLAISTQQSLREPGPSAVPLNNVRTAIVTDRIDFTGPYGVYYREIFFHIPFLLANHLNAQGRFAAAQRWYSYVFDPTANEHIAAELSPIERERRQRDRVWRYVEFRGLDVPRLRATLTDPAAIEAYKRDPFNPHAIARVRLSAYQKSIVMKYVDNLLDWADSLFAEFTMESVNEATMLYSMAATILGDRPPALGSCGEGAVSPKTYERIAPLVKAGSEFLVELETWLLGRRAETPFVRLDRRKLSHRFALEPQAIAHAAGLTAEAATRTSEADPTVEADGLMLGDWNRARVASWDVRRAPVIRAVDDGRSRVVEQPVRELDQGAARLRAVRTASRFGWHLTRQLGPVFCVPHNRELLAYWDRVEDRLFKIRNCRDITGARRELALFAPEIDPRLLVRARAAGLSLDEVLGATTGNLPPYRFAFLIERAKAYAATVQSFGAALLAALEKKDIEELTRIRTVQQQNILKLTTRIRQWDIDTAEDAIETLERQRAAAEYRRDYFQGLVTENLSAWEQTQSGARNAASVLQVVAGTLDTLAGIKHLAPQVGSPFSMKWGGSELGTSARSWSGALLDAAGALEASAAAAGLEASFERRKEGWEHQIELAKRDVGALEKQLEAARLRHEIAVRSLEIHDASIEQLEELHAFYGDKFTGLGLYTFLASTLQRIYREAYNSAYGMARLAEQAYRFERNDDTSELLAPSYWDASRAGLLAGERLLIDLQNMERRFLETNYRCLEIDQALSLTQVDPAALVRLRETGNCEFVIPEVFFDLFYPGHYRRRVKSVRLTIPCVTGPYTNVSATLTLLGSSIRNEPRIEADALVPLPLRRSVSIATSTAQQDAGVYELNFRDERYMPFEGAGTLSSWRLMLPRTFRPFDYRTINDVILHVTYTAETDELLREHVEQRNAELEGTLRNVLATSGLTRVFSLRNDFSGAFQQLLHQPKGTPVRVGIGPEHFPLFLQGIELRATAARVALAPTDGAPGGFRLAVDGQELSSFAADAELGGLPARDAAAAFVPDVIGDHVFAVVEPDTLAVEDPVPGDLSAIDADKLNDVIVFVDYATA